MTDAVVHASASPRLHATVGPGRVGIAVYDEDPTMPLLREPDADRPGGRGLHLVESIASRRGTDRIDTGKVVWFEIDL